MRYNDVNNHNDQVLLTITDSQRAYNNFVNAIKSPQTRKKYSHWLFMYLNYINLDKESLHLLLLEDPKKIQQDLIDYVNWLKNKKLSYSTIKTRLYALFFFFDMNDVEIANKKKKISRNLPENIKTVKDRAYTREEIKRIIDASDLKTKIVVSLMVSTGCRIGAIPDLKYSALKYIEKYKLYEIFLYERTQEEYYSFTTPECAQYINEYLEYRKRGGEIITPDSPLVRNDFVMGDLRAKIPKKMAKGTLTDRLRNILLKTGLRIPSTTNERKEVAINNGFRKYFDTVCIDNDVNVINKELLMGHSVGLDENYYRPIINKKALSEYLKVVNDLTINDEFRLRKENIELKEDLQTRIQELEGTIQVYRNKEIEREEQERKDREQFADINAKVKEIIDEFGMERDDKGHLKRLIKQRKQK